MQKKGIEKIICLMFATIFFVSINAVAFQENNENTKVSSYISEDIDPLVDLNVTVTVKEIRAFDKIDLRTYPDFFVKIVINGVEHISPIWNNTKYVKPNWSITKNVPDDEEFVVIDIQLWDADKIADKKCDISSNMRDNVEKKDVTLYYSLKTGHWMNDDQIEKSGVKYDVSGYGRLNGCDDNSIYKNERDCELWFDISQNDKDGDGIPYWTEENIYGTNPKISNTGEDKDEDGVPIEWEHKWGHFFFWERKNDSHEYILSHGWDYNPFIWENHSDLDPDNDGLDNVEEYKTSQWGSDPFRKDLFLEIDEMDEGPNGEGRFIPDLTFEILKNAYRKHNLVLHLDHADEKEMNGGDIIPFDNCTTGGHGTKGELSEIYYRYFLNNDSDYWRRGVFHYGLLLYHSSEYPGFAFRTTINGKTVLDSFQVSKTHSSRSKKSLARNIVRMVFNRDIHPSEILFDRQNQLAIKYASAIMHETGHTLGIFRQNTPGCDVRPSVDPLKKEFWIWHPYKSCMNYQYTYTLVDYSDGSHGKNDFDDWDRIDLTYFQR